MPKLDAEFKKQIKSLSKTNLEEIVIRVAGKNKEIYDFLLGKDVKITSETLWKNSIV